MVHESRRDPVRRRIAVRWSAYASHTSSCFASVRCAPRADRSAAGRAAAPPKRTDPRTAPTSPRRRRTPRRPRQVSHSRCCRKAPATSGRRHRKWRSFTTRAGRPTARCSTARSPRGTPNTFSVGGLIKGFSEGLQLMTVGEKRRFWIPQELAYRGQPGRPAGMLVFDVELLEILPDPIAPPPDVAAPPSDAKRTPSGLAYKVLRPGKGTTHPGATQPGDRALHGLDHRRQDVRQLASSAGSPRVRPRRSHPGLDRRRAADGRRREDALLDSAAARVQRQAGMPAGMLVFDIELISHRSQ